MIAGKAGSGVLASDIEIVCTDTTSFDLVATIHVTDTVRTSCLCTPGDISNNINANLLSTNSQLQTALSTATSGGGAGIANLQTGTTVVLLQGSVSNLSPPSPPPPSPSPPPTPTTSTSGSSGTLLTTASGTAVTLQTLLAGAAAVTSPNTFTSTTARKDPHLHFADGGRADFRGEHDKIFNFLSARNVSLNVKTIASDFEWTSGKIVDGKASEGTRLIHGTKMEAAYWHVRTIAPGYLHGRRLLLTYRASAPTAALLETSDFQDSRRVDCQLHFLRKARACRQKTTTWTSLTLEAGDDFEYDNVHVSLSEDAKKLVVTVQGRWELSAVVSAFPFAALNRGKRLLDIEAKALYDADHDTVAPHGLFGQSFDGDDLEVSGKVDTRAGVETTTQAQAEGAIEGTWRDYLINCDPKTKPAGAHCEHSPEWKYSRFDKTAAKPRDVSKLTGTKRMRGAKAKANRMSAARPLPDGWTDVG